MRISEIKAKNYLVNVLDQKTGSAKVIKKYLITDLEAWAEKKGVTMDDVWKSIKTHCPIKGASNSYRVDRWISH